MTLTVDYAIQAGITGVPAGTAAATEGAAGAYEYPGGSATGAITITSADNTLVDGLPGNFIDIPLTNLPLPAPGTMETFGVKLTGPASDAFASTFATQFILNTEPTPATGPTLTVAASATTFNETGTGSSVTITATLNAPATTDTIVGLTFTPNTIAGLAGATLGDQYIIAFTGSGTQSGVDIVIPAGQASASITLTGTGFGQGRSL